MILSIYQKQYFYLLFHPNQQLIFTRMNILCGSLKHQEYSLQAFPPSQTVSTFKTWTAIESIDQFQYKIGRKHFPRIRLNYGSVDREIVRDASINDSLILRYTYSKEYMSECESVTIKFLKEETLSILKDKEQDVRFRDIKSGSILIMAKKAQTIINNKTKWVDKDFFRPSEYVGQKNKKYKLQWRRLDYLMDNDNNKSYNFIIKPIQTINICQGLVGDCYFLSAIAAITDPLRPQRILKIFPSLDSIKLNQKGIYKARLMFKGIFQEVVIDDYFPFYKDQRGDLQLLGCKPCPKKKSIYPLVLQKCWAKLCKSYQNINGGYSSVALHALSGALAKNYNISLNTSKAEKEAIFFQKMNIFCMNKYAICAGTEVSTIANVFLKQNQQLIKKSIKIPQNHVFCIVGMNKQEKMVNIYNPWGVNIASKNNASSTKTPNEAERTVSGQFWIPWQSFKESFHHITVCKIHDNAHYLYSQLIFKSKEMKFIELNVYEQRTGYFSISLSQTYQKSEDHRYLNVNFIVLKCMPGGQFEIVTIRSKQHYSDHYLELHSLKQGKYLIAIYIHEQVKESLTFGVYSEGVFGFIQKSFTKKFTDHFLPRILLGFDNTIRKEKHKIYPKGRPMGEVWISANMIGDSAIGYIILNAGRNEEGCELVMSRQSFQEVGLTLLYPYDTQLVRLTAKPGYSSVATVMITDFKKYEDLQFSNNRSFFRQLSKGPQKYWNQRQP